MIYKMFKANIKFVLALLIILNTSTILFAENNMHDSHIIDTNTSSSKSIKQDSTNKTNERDSKKPIDWIPIAGFLTTLVALSYNIYQNNRILNNQKNKDEIEYKKKLLFEFYTPLESYLHLSYALSRGFKERFKDTNNTLLDSLLSEQDTLNDSEKRLVKEILTVGKSIEKLIIEKSGLVVDNDLHMEHNNNLLTLLTEAITHIRIIRMAYEGNLKQTELDKHFEELKKHVFPKNLTKIISEKKTILQSELKVK